MNTIAAATSLGTRPLAIIAPMNGTRITSRPTVRRGGTVSWPIVKLSSTIASSVENWPSGFVTRSASIIRAATSTGYCRRQPMAAIAGRVAARCRVTFSTVSLVKASTRASTMKQAAIAASRSAGHRGRLGEGTLTPLTLGQHRLTRIGLATDFSSRAR